MSETDAYPSLFSPFEMAGYRLKNRIAHASIALRYGAAHGMHDSYFQYFVNRARGGAGMLITDPPGIIPAHPSERIVAWNSSMEDDLRRLADGVNREDCLLLTQIQDAGRGRHVPGRTMNAMGASHLPDDLSYTMPHPLNVSEIEGFIEFAARSARRLKQCGFAGAEISACHGHLFHQFLSPRSNHREDSYGGDLAGRCRFLVDLCLAIRVECGKDFILGIKFPGDDGIADSIPPDVAAEIARHVTSRVDCDYLTYAQGTHHRTLDMHIPDDSAPRVTYMGLIRKLREATPGVPVMALGRITDPAEAEGIVARGDAEMVGLGRALIVDPAWPDKARRGRARDIRYCVSCNTCWKLINANSHLRCDNNPLLARTDEIGFAPALAPVRKNVAVVGAGIAGLEAAWTAAARGHHVTLFGSSRDVGGKTRLHARLPSSESLSSVYDYQLIAAQKAGVRFELGAPASVADILAGKPDEVVLATGATMTWPVCLPEELREQGFVPDLREAMEELLKHAPGHSQPKPPPEEGCAVILDMDQTEATYAAAELLKERFTRVVVLTQRQGIAEDVVLVTRQRILRRFAELGIEVMPLVEPRWSSTFEEDGSLEIASVFGPLAARIENVAFFSYSTPRSPNDSLRKPLLEAGLPVYSIGDCKKARDVLAATTEGSAIGLQLGTTPYLTTENLMEPFKLDPKTTALVLIDLQYGIVAMKVAPTPSELVVSRSAELAKAFRAAKAPVILVNVGNLPDGGDALAPKTDAPPAPAGEKPANWMTIVDELSAEPSDIRITKRQWGAFHGTELDLQLRRRGIKTLVLAGLSTNVGVESTARDAFERGYDQVFVEDAMASPSAEAHTNTLKFIFPRIGRLRSGREVIAALA